MFECLVVFTDGSHTHWWSKFMKKGYRHCFLLYPLTWTDELFTEQWTVIVDPSTNYMKTQVITDPPDKVLEAIGEITEVIKCRVANIDQTKYSIEVRTCVTIVKLVLGQRWWWIQTPWGLRNKLLKSPLVEK